jgi:hypothetical protein
MLPTDRDRKLSQLFQLKKNLEQPDAEFWASFDVQLRQKFLEREVRPSPWERWCSMVQRYRSSLRSFAYATAAYCLLILGVLQFQTAPVAPSKIAAEQIMDDVIALDRSWGGATLAFDVPKEQTTHYICNNMYISELNSRTKELAF